MTHIELGIDPQIIYSDESGVGDGPDVSPVFGPIESNGELNKILDDQLTAYLDQRLRVQEMQGYPEHAINDERRFLEERYSDIFRERNSRGDEAASPEAKHAIEIISELFGNQIHGISCIDSRVMRTIAYGLPLRTGIFTRVEAGDVADFVQGQGEELVLMKGSYFETAIKQAFDTSDTPIEVIDSHIECAARKRDEKERTGVEQPDKGLFADVVRKKRMVKSIGDHVDEAHPGRHALLIQTSFNPENGYMYMGLEKDESMSFAKDHAQDEARKGKKSVKHAKPYFTNHVLNELAENGSILHSEDIANDPEIQAMFDANLVDDLDWETNYAFGMEKFWGNIDSMVRDGLLDMVMDRVNSVYPDDPEDINRARSLLLIANSFNAYTLTKNFGYWPYKDHNENCVVFAEKVPAPLKKNRAFAVFSKAREELPSGAKTAIGIIRQNREGERIKDITKTYPDIPSYIAAPVPATLEVAVKHQDIDWDSVRAIDWSELPEDWRTMPDNAFETYIINHGGEMAPLVVTHALKLLRDKMAILYDPRNKSSEPMLEGQIEVLPVLVDDHWRIQAIIPLIYNGFANN